MRPAVKLALNCSHAPLEETSNGSHANDVADRIGQMSIVLHLQQPVSSLTEKGQYGAHIWVKISATVVTSESSQDTAYLFPLHQEGSFIDICCEGGRLAKTFTFDTGAEFTAISKKEYQNVQARRLEQSTKVLYTWSKVPGAET